jgi:hypothetical protein
VGVGVADPRQPELAGVELHPRRLAHAAGVARVEELERVEVHVLVLVIADLLQAPLPDAEGHRRHRMGGDGDPALLVHGLQRLVERTQRRDALGR